MTRIGALLFCHSFLFSSYGQSPKDFKVYLENPTPILSIEEALLHPDSILSLSLKKQKLTKVPQEIRQFKNLEVLDLRKNKLDSLPDWLTELSQLKVLVISRNSYKHFPDVICQLPNLIVLQAGENLIELIPESINQLQKLEFLDLWSNELTGLPDEVGDLKNLKVVDIRVTSTNAIAQDYIRELLPNTKIFFSSPCKCGD